MAVDTAPPHRRREVRSGVSAMLAQGLRAYQAFAGLRELSENLRILSLNAELAAGRAGGAGAGIRALTHMTRELVRQLAAIDAEMARLKQGTYGAGAEALKHSNRLRLLAGARGAGSAVARERRRVLADAERVNGCIRDLARQAAKVGTVAQQARMVATNIAIEAAHAGAHGREFHVVADTMADYTGQLAAMTESADAAVAAAARAGGSLQARPLEAAA